MNAARIRLTRLFIIGAFLFSTSTVSAYLPRSERDDHPDWLYYSMLGPNAMNNNNRKLTPEQQDKAYERYRKQKRGVKRLHSKVEQHPHDGNMQERFQDYIHSRETFIKQKQQEINGEPREVVGHDGSVKSLQDRIQELTDLQGEGADDEWKLSRRIDGLVKQRERAQKEIEEAMAEVESLKELGGDDGADYEENYTRALQDIDEAEKRLQKRSFSNPIAHAAIRGLAGEKGFLIFRDIEPESVMQGLVAGGVYRLAEVAGRKLEQTIETELGSIWDTVIGGGFRAVKENVQNGWYWLFHGGDRPFSAHQIETWKREVLQVVLEGLEKRARDAQKEQSAGRDARMRSLFDAAGQGDDGHVEELAQITDPTWEAIAQGYAKDLDRLVQRIEAFKPFYAPKSDEQERRQHASEKSDIMALASRLQETLILIKEHILLPSGSLKDLAAGDTKLFLPQLYKDIERRFDLLIDVVNSYHGARRKDEPVARKSKSSDKVDKHYHEHRGGLNNYPY